MRGLFMKRVITGGTADAVFVLTDELGPPEILRRTYPFCTQLLGTRGSWFT